MDLLLKFARTCILLAILTSFAHGQDTGVSFLGTQRTTRDPVLDSYGVVELWDARYGFVFNQMGGTNVVQWRGINNSEYVWTKYASTNLPAYVSTTTTNNFPAISFANASTNVLFSHNLAKLFANGQPITVFMLTCAQTSGVAMNPFGLGDINATNNNANIFRYTPHTGTGGQTFGLGLSFNTNQAIVNYNAVGLGRTTNIFNWGMASYSNNTIFLMQNLVAAGTTISNPGTIQFNTATLGAYTRANGVQNGSWMGGVLSVIGVCTNASFDGAATNLMNYMNTQYANGLYRVY